jgi:hypothetical protein
MASKALHSISSDASQLFSCFELISFLFFLITIVHTTWTRCPEQELIKLDEIPIIPKYYFCTAAAASILFVLSRISEFVEAGITTEFSSRQFLSKYRSRFEPHMFFFLSSETRGQKLGSPFLDLICTFAYISSRLMRLFGVLTVFSGIILYAGIVDRFCSQVNGKDCTLFQFRSHFYRIKSQIEALNSLINRIVLAFTLHLFPMFMMWSTDLFYDSESSNVNASFREKASFFIDFVIIAGFYGMAASNYGKVCTK